MPLPQERTYTIEDIYALPEGTRAELIDGKIYYMAPPTATHQRILNYLNTEINLYIRNNNGECEVFPAPFAVHLFKDDEKYLEPDISVICERKKINDKGCYGAPDWVIEIVSPASRQMDYGTKQALYLAAGVKEYWIVDPMRKNVMVYCASEDWVPTLYRFTDKIRVGIYDDLEIDFTEMEKSIKM